MKFTRGQSLPLQASLVSWKSLRKEMTFRILMLASQLNFYYLLIIICDPSHIIVSIRILYKTIK